jgi:hypothetical protein
MGWVARLVANSVRQFAFDVIIAHVIVNGEELVPRDFLDAVNWCNNPSSSAIVDGSNIFVAAAKFGEIMVPSTMAEEDGLLHQFTASRKSRGTSSSPLTITWAMMTSNANCLTELATSRATQPMRASQQSVK